MEIDILRIGEPDPNVIQRIQENLNTNFAKTRCTQIANSLPIPKAAYNKAKHQYRSDIILDMILNYAAEEDVFDRVLGIADFDMFTPRLSFVFGEAECPGKAAVISLRRLRPEFYRKTANMEILVDRSTKGAIHELGHTAGLKHCANPFCIMYFSNSVFETDRKRSMFCNKCSLKIQAAMDNPR